MKVFITTVAAIIVATVICQWLNGWRKRSLIVALAILAVGGINAPEIQDWCHWGQKPDERGNPPSDTSHSQQDAATQIANKVGKTPSPYAKSTKREIKRLRYKLDDNPQDHWTNSVTFLVDDDIVLEGGTKQSFVWVSNYHEIMMPVCRLNKLTGYQVTWDPQYNIFCVERRYDVLDKHRFYYESLIFQCQNNNVLFIGSDNEVWKDPNTPSTVFQEGNEEAGIHCEWLSNPKTPPTLKHCPIHDVKEPFLTLRVLLAFLGVIDEEFKWTKNVSEINIDVPYNTVKDFFQRSELPLVNGNFHAPEGSVQAFVHPPALMSS